MTPCYSRRRRVGTHDFAGAAAPLNLGRMKEVARMLTRSYYVGVSGVYDVQSRDHYDQCCHTYLIRHTKEQAFQLQDQPVRWVCEHYADVIAGVAMRLVLASLTVGRAMHAETQMDNPHARRTEAVSIQGGKWLPYVRAAQRGVGRCGTRDCFVYCPGARQIDMLYRPTVEASLTTRISV